MVIVDRELVGLVVLYERDKDNYKGYRGWKKHVETEKQIGRETEQRD